MTSDKLTLKDLLREFNRGNFYHVNDIDENKSYSNLTCEKTYQYLEAYEKLQKQKSGLMHDLLTGKVPVNADDESPESAHV